MESKAISEVFFENSTKDKIFLYLEDESYTYQQITELCFDFIYCVMEKNLLKKEFYIFSSSPKAIIVSYLALNYLNKDVNIVSENVKELLLSENGISKDNVVLIQSEEDFNNYICKKCSDVSKIQTQLSLIKNRNSSLIQYTSGTTGKPSKIVRTKESCYVEAMDLVMVWKYNEQSRIACFTPFSYSFAFGNVVMAAVISCSSIISCKKFNVKQVLQLLEKNEATHFVTVVSIIKLLLVQQSTKKLNFLKYIICSGSKIAKKDEKKFYSKFKIHVSEQYGMTETGALLYSYISNDYFEDIFPSVDYRIENNILYVKRNFTGLDEINTKDFVYQNRKNQIKILGRSDSVLKLDDKRYSVEYISSLFENEDYLTIAKKLLSSKKIVLYSNENNKKNVKNIVAKLKAMEASLRIKIVKVK
jgi:acyl-coenzyme A synthetase/AMP-(fatty) acid ligase